MNESVPETDELNRCRLSLPAPAKINLFLHILGRQPDGYHELQTAFQFLEFGDVLEFTARNDEQIVVTPALAGIPPEHNLIWRAAQCLRQATGCNQGVHIQLHKQIPLGSGLGGGSSDAATTLLGLNALWGTALSTATLLQLGLTLGADVPVFLAGYAAFAEGVGERLQPIQVPERWCLLVIPDCSVSTAEIFATPQLPRNTPPITPAEFLAQGGHNDCTQIVRQQYPAVDEAFCWLSRHTEAKMSGTGCCLYALFDSAAEAHALQAKMPSSLRGLVTRTLNHSPLHTALAAI